LTGIKTGGHCRKGDADEGEQREEKGRMVLVANDKVRPKGGNFKGRGLYFA